MLVNHKKQNKKDYLYFGVNNINFVTNLAAALNPTETMNEIAEIDMLQKQNQTKKNQFMTTGLYKCVPFLVNGNDTQLKF